MSVSQRLEITRFTYEDGLDASTDLANITCSFAPDSTFEVVGNSIVCHYVPQTIEGAYWTGAANDGNLSTAGNWSGNQVPTSGNVTIALAAATTLIVGDTFHADKPLKWGDYVLFGNVPTSYADHLDVTGTALGGRAAKLKDDGENLILSIPPVGLSVIIR